MADKAGPEAPTSDTKQYDPSQLTLVRMIDPDSGFWGMLCSPDNGVHWTYEYGPEGKKYHKRDIERISRIPFEHIKMKSPDGTAFYLSVSDDGKPVFTPVEKVGENE